jgi:hypothetical protein
MASAQPDTVLRHIRLLVAAEQAGRQSDAQLLEQFALHHDQTAFAAGAPTRAVGHRGVPARFAQRPRRRGYLAGYFPGPGAQSHSIARPESVGSWLYQVAYRVAVRARARVARRQQHERQAGRQPQADPLADVTGRELLALLDEELHELPPYHRAPLVLCYLEGRTRDQAARQLGWSLRTLKHRLAQGRERLRARLARRGVTLPAALLAAGLGEGVAQAALGARLVLWCGRVQGPTPGTVSR